MTDNTADEWQMRIVIFMSCCCDRKNFLSLRLQNVVVLGQSKVHRHDNNRMFELAFLELANNDRRSSGRALALAMFQRSTSIVLFIYNSDWTYAIYFFAINEQTRRQCIDAWWIARASAPTQLRTDSKAPKMIFSIHQRQFMCVFDSKTRADSHSPASALFMLDSLRNCECYFD